MQRARIPLFYFADFLLKAPSKTAKEAERVFLLLHGYEQSGEKIYSKLEPAISSAAPAAAILAPNGPFPIPKRVENGYQMGFSWYFYDPARDDYFIDMEIGVSFIAGLARDRKLSALPMTVIGFSQGGYLAPFVAQALPQVDHVIGIGCSFLGDELARPLKIRLDAIHGALDDVVPVEDAEQRHAKLLDSGASGRFVRIADTGHRIDSRVQGVLREMISSKI